MSCPNMSCLYMSCPRAAVAFRPLSSKFPFLVSRKNVQIWGQKTSSDPSISVRPKRDFEPKPKHRNFGMFGTEPKPKPKQYLFEIFIFKRT